MNVTDKMIQYLIDAKEVVVADIETTGCGTSNYDDITQISGVLVDLDQGKILGKYNQYCKLVKRKSIPKEVVELTGITDEKLERDGVPVDEALRKFWSFADGRLLLFHNYRFDWLRFLLPEFERIGIDASPLPVGCTYLISKKLLPSKDDGGPENLKLGTLVAYFGSSIVNAHNAFADCKYTASVARKLKGIAQDSWAGETPSCGLLEPSAEQVFDLSKLQIKSASYWEKGKFKRVYVTCNAGNIYYDIPKAVWEAKELFGGSVDFDAFQTVFLRYSQVDSMEDAIKKYIIKAGKPVA